MGAMVEIWLKSQIDNFTLGGLHIIMCHQLQKTGV